MKTRMTKMLVVMLLMIMVVGCGQTHRQQWYQTSVAFTGTLNTATILVEQGVIDKDDIRPLMPAIEQANESLKELAVVADICDENPEACNQELWDYLLGQVSDVLTNLDTLVLDNLEGR